MNFAFLALMGVVCAGCGGTGAADGNHIGENAGSENGGDNSPAAGGTWFVQTGGDVGAGGASAIGAGGGNLAGAGGNASSMSDAGGDSSLPVGNASTLKATGKLIGTALSTGHLTDTSYGTIAGNEFDYVTPENEMKWDSTEQTQNQFRFTGGDQIVQFAEAHGMKVKGHTLVWHSQLPTWMQNMTGADAVRAAMTNHIQKVMQHFHGHVIAWDVVNEAVDGAALRSDVFLQQIGPTYLAEAFRIAHAADPDALLFYNDYGAEGGGAKSDAVFTMIKGLLDAAVPITGVGLQMHIGLGGSPSTAEVAANIKRYVDIGLKVNISEMDVSLCKASGTKMAALATQQTRYHDIIKACLDSTGCQAVTLWGVTDKYSWLNSAMACATQDFSPWALAFDDDYQKKPAYTGILNALLGK